MENEFSGRTTNHHPIHDDSWEKDKDGGAECIIQETVFDVQRSNCPIEVEKEVRQFWRDREFGNDHYYGRWDASLEEEYPVIASFLKSKGVTDCLIHWWW